MQNSAKARKHKSTKRHNLYCAFILLYINVLNKEVRKHGFIFIFIRPCLKEKIILNNKSLIYMSAFQLITFFQSTFALFILRIKRKGGQKMIKRSLKNSADNNVKEMVCKYAFSR